jgi:hypothetical protein
LSLQGYFITSKSSFPEWLIYQEGDTSPNSNSVAEVQPLLGNIYDFVVYEVAMPLINDKEDTMKCIEMCRINAKDYYIGVEIGCHLSPKFLVLQFYYCNYNIFMEHKCRHKN